MRTAGNHRRFRVEALERFSRGEEEAPPAEPLGPWLTTLLEGGVREAHARLLAERASASSWAEVSDRMGPVLTELGERWARGDLSVVEEHLASGRLARALAQASNDIAISSDAPRAMLVTATGDEHTLGLALAELTLRELGWRTLWAGRRTPVEDLGPALRSQAVRLLAVSASRYSNDEDALSRFVAAASDACRAAGTQLVVGGRGRWPEADHRFDRATSFATLRELATLR